MRGCRLCGSQRLEALLDLGRMPVAHRLLERADQAEERFPFALSLCAACSLVQIVDAIPPEQLYRGFNYNFSSWKFEPHIDAELDAIVERVAPRSVLEIGCNDGRFLDALRARGAPACAGIEPNPAPGALARARGFPVYEGWASTALVEGIVRRSGSFDLVVSRQVFEHVHDLRGFLRAARAALPAGGHLFVDIPDWGPARDLGDCSVLWEEHVNYYTDATLLSALARAGFAPVWSTRYDFSGTTLAVLARRSDEPVRDPLPASLERELRAARGFPRLVHAYRSRLVAALERARAHGARVALYGVGVRACTAANALDLGPYVDAVLDDQPQRQGKFMPGTRLPIVAPARLDGEAPLLCVLAVNNENEASVRARFDSLATTPVTYLSLCGPADIWTQLERIESVSWAA